ncbi:HAMP domain-containing protein [Streptomyces coeruleorubidus]|uniref:sensor histidine kinase n=1 Tax=Streptomyces coeruleorubidus TaxID=116188 RepID=UPI00237F34D1|nr:ATP-binding protein [Streptomyces coeruleorubidus]WDV56719.1 HAMP domain-containing protein [Streptomyces coeruleorubidus]
MATVLDRWPFRRKLNVLVIAPIAVVGVLLGVGAYGQVRHARDAGRIADLVRDSEQVAQLINDIQAEHRQALLLSVQYDSARPGVPLPPTTDYRRAQRSTDAQAAAVRAAFASGLPPEEAQALDYIRGLGVLREKLERGYVPAANIDPAYASAVEYLIGGIGLGRYSGTSSSVVTLLDTVLRADASHAAFESAVFSAQTRDANALTEYSRAVGARKLYDHQLDRFERIATPAQVLRMDGIRRRAEQHGVEARFAELQIDPGALQGQTPTQLRKAIADGTRQSEARLGITRSLIEQTAARADAVSADALRNAVYLLGLTLVGFAAWLTFCVLIRRSVVRPLEALTRSAQEVVDVAGEELARVSDDESADSTPLRPRSIPVPVRDEIGELAEAFNQVQVTAAQLLERQVLSRRNVAEMFGNVGRRVSNLTTRQLMLIDAVEREETDPELLERLYSIDHIAVRLQRNADSLMLLAGIRETGVEARPTPLANVIRASLGQIEGYQRVSLRPETEVTVAPDIVGDLTLMLAELLENAVAFSPSHTPVEVAVRPGTDVTEDGGALIEVIDHGLGMSAERLAEENARLVRRERLDLVPTRVLGLFAVGSLARRWGVRVSLSRTPGGGVTATVWIPASLLLTMSHEDPEDAEQPVETGPIGAVAAFPVRSGQETAAPAPSRVPVSATGVTERSVTPSSHDALPRRIPARTGAGPTTAERTVEDAGGERAAASAEQRAAQDSRPLRRRVRGATLAMTSSRADREAPTVRQPADAEAVRSELDEFEAAVRRAEQDSAHARTKPAPSHHQQSQKESGSDHVDS